MCQLINHGPLQASRVRVGKDSAGSVALRPYAQRLAAQAHNRDLADRHPATVLAALHIKNLSASAAGAADAPGKKVGAKARLNRGVLTPRGASSPGSPGPSIKL